MTTPTTRITRLPEKGVSDRAALVALLDEEFVGHVGVVRDGHTVVIPTAIDWNVPFAGSDESSWEQEYEEAIRQPILHGPQPIHRSLQLAHCRSEFEEAAMELIPSTRSRFDE